MATSMAGSSGCGGRGGRVVGEYIFGRQIGSGSFSVVWHARHRLHGTEVAVKEIVMEKLSKKLQDSLLSEIDILKKINHPNIIALHDIIKASGRIFLVLEYCKGGDLSLYIQRRGRVPEATAKHFMQQLASGLQVLRDNNLIHRDLKPQNLLLSKNDESSVLKIADFGFARSLQPRGLAETLCGSPLYMAPEIMQLQKYDAKADLWSVGAILYQLVTGRTPFTGNNQIQLLQNIVKSSELQFPRDTNDLSHDCIDLCQKLLRRNPVERLTFEEFFNHPFLLESNPEESLRIPLAPKTLDVHPLITYNEARPSPETFQEDCLPFILDDVSSEPAERTSIQIPKSTIRPTYGFSVDTKIDKRPTSVPSTSSKRIPDRITARLGWDKPYLGNLEETKSPSEQMITRVPSEAVMSSSEQRHTKVSSEDHAMVDSLESIDQEYVFVRGPPLEMSSSSLCASRPHNSESESSSVPPLTNCALSAPMAIIGAATSKSSSIASLENYHCFPGTSQGSVDMRDAMEQPSSHCMTRIKSLQQCASAISELVKEKVDMHKQLEAFSIQLVILAVWKQALHICHAQAASAIEGSPSQEIRFRGSMNKKENIDSHESVSSTGSQQPDSAQIERIFLIEVENAESLTRDLGPFDDTTEMPDAMEIIYQSALSLGRNGAVDELMNNMETATVLYSKAVQLLYFLLVEAPALILNPPFSLTTSDKARIRSYIDILNSRQSQYRSQRMDLLKGDNQQGF